MNKLIEKAKVTHNLDENEILQLLQNDDINDELFKAADEVRQKYLGDYVDQIINKENQRFKS